ncbi:MAG: hypothetical protein ACI9HY_004268, partial [Planctomycetaceae bacterium]
MQSHKLDGFSTVQNMKIFFKITLLAFLSASF